MRGIYARWMSGARRSRSHAAARAERAGANGAAWADLLDLAPGEVAVVVEHDAGRGATALEALGATATVAAIGDGPPAGCALVVLDGVEPDLPALQWAAGALAPGGRLAVVADNGLSPLRAIDRLRGRAVGPEAVRSHGALVRRLRAAGFAPERELGLLRSSAAPVTAFDLAAPATATEVLRATQTHVVDRRRGALDALMVLARRGLAAPVVPAWLVIARKGSAPAPLDPLRATGRIGFWDSGEAKVVRGEPPAALEKRYRSAEAADAEVAALEELARCGVASVPRVLARPDPQRVRLSWLPGRTLALRHLEADELEQWIARAAEVLAHVQSATRAADASVLVHGDFWLGNVVVHGDRVSGVIDWATASRGDPALDADYLVSCTARFCGADPARLRRAAARALTAS